MMYLIKDLCKRACLKYHCALEKPGQFHHYKAAPFLIHGPIVYLKTNKYLVLL